MFKLSIVLLVAGVFAATFARAADLSADSSVTPMFAAATLAPSGSFEMNTAPVYTRVIVINHIALGQLKRNEISKSHAQSILAVTHAARVLADQSLDACREDSAGKCTGDQGKALRLLGMARKVLGGVK